MENRKHSSGNEGDSSGSNANEPVSARQRLQCRSNTCNKNKTETTIPFECTYTTTRITRTTSWFCCCCRWLVVALSNNASQAQPNFISIQARFLVQQKQRALGRWRVSVNDDAAGDRMVTPLHFEMRVSTPLNSKQQNSVLKYRPCVCVCVCSASSLCAPLYWEQFAVHSSVTMTER